MSRRRAHGGTWKRRREPIGRGVAAAPRPSCVVFGLGLARLGERGSEMRVGGVREP